MVIHSWGNQRQFNVSCSQILHLYLCNCPIISLELATLLDFRVITTNKFSGSLTSAVVIDHIAVDSVHFDCSVCYHVTTDVITACAWLSLAQTPQRLGQNHRPSTSKLVGHVQTNFGGRRWAWDKMYVSIFFPLAENSWGHTLSWFCDTVGLNFTRLSHSNSLCTKGSIAGQQGWLN